MTGRSPKVEEIAQAIGERRERVADAITAAEAYSVLSLDQPAAEGSTTQDLTGGPDPGYGLVDDRLMVQQAWRVLDERKRRIFFERFYEGRLQREIADEIGVSQMQVSRLISQGLEQMRTHLDDVGAHRPAA